MSCGSRRARPCELQAPPPPPLPMTARCHDVVLHEIRQRQREWMMLMMTVALGEVAMHSPLQPQQRRPRLRWAHELWDICPIDLHRHRCVRCPSLAARASACFPPRQQGRHRRMTAARAGVRHLRHRPRARPARCPWPGHRCAALGIGSISPPAQSTAARRTADISNRQVAHGAVRCPCRHSLVVSHCRLHEFPARPHRAATVGPA